MTGAMAERERYEFTSTWTVDAPPDAVFDVLRDVAGYARWWPQVRTSRQLDPRSVEMRCRSQLPFVLRFTVEETRTDPVARLLEGTLRGDLEGWSRWQLTGSGGGTSVQFDEVAATTRWLMNLLAPLARGLFRSNHERMMRDGELGLRHHLATLTVP